MSSGFEIQVLSAFVAQPGLDAPEILARATQIVARFGGYIQRARAPPPDTKGVWRVCTTLTIEQKAGGGRHAHYDADAVWSMGRARTIPMTQDATATVR